MKPLVSLLAAASLFALAPAAHAAVVTLEDPDALDGSPGQFEDPLNFYAGGSGSRQTGPGPNLGITFAGGLGGRFRQHTDTCTGSLVARNAVSAEFHRADAPGLVH